MHTQDPLRGLTVAEARTDALRLTIRAQALTDVLARTTYGMTAVVRANVEAERDALEREASALESALAEVEGLARVRRAFDRQPQTGRIPAFGCEVAYLTRQEA